MLRNFFVREHRDAEGQTLVEYALLLFLIAVAVLVILTALGNSVNNVFSTINSVLQPAPAAPAN